MNYECLRCNYYETHEDNNNNNKKEEEYERIFSIMN
jgi:hypothetical protein